MSVGLRTLTSDIPHRTDQRLSTLARGAVDRCERLAASITRPTYVGVVTLCNTFTGKTSRLSHWQVLNTPAPGRTGRWP